MAATVGSMPFTSRSFFVPKTLARTASIMYRSRYGRNLQIPFYSVNRDGRSTSVLAPATIRTMAPESGMTRRSLVLSALAAAALRAEGHKGEVFASEAFRYPDPLTEIEVYRLTFPDYSSTLTAYYNRGISNNSNWMLCASNRSGSLQGFRLDL